ncbi:MAG: hypothetical protein IJP56_04375 [Synergistaceae bacterium]|nr:hypothetical protein [Synergistaceae bacterium]
MRAKLYGFDKNVLLSYYYQNQNEMNGLVNSVHNNKVIKAVMGLVKVNEVDELTPEAQPENKEEAAN